MKKRINYSFNRRDSRKLTIELNQKIKNNSKIKILKRKNGIIKSEIKDLINKRDNVFNHFDLINNYLLQYTAELNYKFNKKIFNPKKLEKEENIINTNKNNIISLKKLQEIHKNKLIDGKYLLENEAVEHFKKEEEKENKILKEKIYKDNIIYEDLFTAKSELSHITKKLRKQVVKTENNEIDFKNLKLKLDLTKKINTELNNILNRQKKIQNKLLINMKNKTKEVKQNHSFKEKVLFNSPNKSKSIKFFKNNINDSENINKIPNTSRNHNKTVNKFIKKLNLNTYKSPNKKININLSKKTIIKNNYISTTIWNTSRTNKSKLFNLVSNDENNKINELCKFIKEEIKKEENKINMINTLINNELQMKYYIKNLCLKCIDDINDKIRKENKELPENKNELIIFNFIFQKCFK